MSDEPFDDDEEPEADQPAANREAAERRVARRDARIQKELEELRAYKAENEAANRKAQVKDVFQQAELNPRWADFYQGEEATPEAVRAWAVQNELIQVEDEAPAPTTGYTPTVIESGHVPAGKTYTRKEMEEIARDNPARARALADSGKVIWNNPQVAER